MIRILDMEKEVSLKKAGVEGRGGEVLAHSCGVFEMHSDPVKPGAMRKAYRKYSFQQCRRSTMHLISIIARASVFPKSDLDTKW